MLHGLESTCRVNNETVVRTSVGRSVIRRPLQWPSSFMLRNGGAKHPIGPYYTPAAA